MSARKLHLGIITICLGLSSLAWATDNYKIDPEHSTVIFKASHFGISNTYGRFTKVSGDFKVDEKDAAKSSVEFAIDTDSLNTDSEKRDKHLRSPDFLDAKQFSKITFKSDSIKKVGDKAFEISGKLTLHGKTQPLKVTWNKVGAGQDPMGNFRFGGETKFTIKRSDYGIKYMLPAVADDVEMIVSVEGIKQK